MPGLEEFDSSIDNGVLVGKNCIYPTHLACRQQILESFKGKCPQSTASIDVEIFRQPVIIVTIKVKMLLDECATHSDWFLYRQRADKLFLFCP